MPYTDDPANSETDRIRLSVGDTDNGEEGLSDDVYNFLIATTTSEYRAIIGALQYLVAKYASYITEKAGGLFAKESEKYHQYKSLLDDYNRDPSRGGGTVGTGYAGGISIDRIIENDNDLDINQNPIIAALPSNQFVDSPVIPKSFRV